MIGQTMFIGSRVMVQNGFGLSHLTGKEGIIIAGSDNNILVQFDSRLSHLEMHNGYPTILSHGNYGIDKRCWWFHPIDLQVLDSNAPVATDSEIKKIKEIEKVALFEAGMSIDTYVDSLLETKIKKNRLKWLQTFKNCVLAPHIKETITEALTVILSSAKFDEWGINEHFEKGLTNSILLSGPPGTGKTMLSESIAAILGKNLMKIDSGVLQSNIPGQTERNIKKSFLEAKEKDCVLLFDECDSVLSNREAVGVILAAEINCLLTEIENFKGIVILTTNRLHVLDPALSRRIVAKLRLELPDEKTRAEIWAKLMPPKMPLEEDIDFNKLAESALSGGEIKNVILLAARKAIAKNADKVSQQHLLDALHIVQTGSDTFDKAQDKHTNRVAWADFGKQSNNYKESYGNN